jgi:uncharacterized protein
MSVFNASVPVFTQILDALEAVLKKAEAHAAARKIAPEVMLGLRLSPDMFGLTRLAGVELPKYADDEKSFAELYARIATTQAFIAGLPATAFDKAGGRAIQFPMRGRPHEMQGDAYLNTFALPNFYFHATAAYAILRANGVELGKGDFLGTVAGLRVVG